MKSLFDIAPSAITATVRGTTIPVPGIGLADLVALLSRFPALQAVLGGGTKEAIDPAALLQQVPDAACAIIAAGLGHAGDPAAEQHVASLPFGDQLGLFEKVVEATLPDGVDPTVARLNKVASTLGGKSRAKK